MKAKHQTARALYNAIFEKYRDNREKAPNDLTELPTVLRMVGVIRGKDVLDMGCGLGKHVKEFLKRGARVTGYDASERMVELTKEYCEGRGEFFRSENETVSFKPGSFDVVNASLTLNYSKKPAVILKKVARWLKPKGVFVFSVPHPMWLSRKVENMDYSKSGKMWMKLASYDVEIFNHYHPLTTWVGLLNTYHLHLEDIVEPTMPRKYTGWPEGKYLSPDVMVFKARKI